MDTTEGSRRRPEDACSSYLRPAALVSCLCLGAVVVLSTTQQPSSRREELLARPSSGGASKLGKFGLRPGSFTKWYEQQSAADWFGDAKTAVAGKGAKKPELEKFLGKSDIAELHTVAIARAAQQSRAHQVKLAVDRLLARQELHASAHQKEQRLKAGPAAHAPHATATLRGRKPARLQQLAEEEAGAAEGAA
ncbi:hypothetical protein T484DRAFT_1901802, partial [Baffinella frigidus]